MGITSRTKSIYCARWVRILFLCFSPAITSIRSSALSVHFHVIFQLHYFFPLLYRVIYRCENMNRKNTHTHSAQREREGDIKLLPFTWCLPLPFVALCDVPKHSGFCLRRPLQGEIERERMGKIERFSPYSFTFSVEWWIFFLF